MSAYYEFAAAEYSVLREKVTLIGANSPLAGGTPTQSQVQRTPGGINSLYASQPLDNGTTDYVDESSPLSGRSAINKTNPLSINSGHRAGPGITIDTSQSQLNSHPNYQFHNHNHDHNQQGGITALALASQSQTTPTHVLIAPAGTPINSQFQSQSMDFSDIQNSPLDRTNAKRRLFWSKIILGPAGFTVAIEHNLEDRSCVCSVKSEAAVGSNNKVCLERFTMRQSDKRSGFQSTATMSVQYPRLSISTKGGPPVLTVQHYEYQYDSRTRSTSDRIAVKPFSKNRRWAYHKFRITFKSKRDLLALCTNLAPYAVSLTPEVIERLSAEARTTTEAPYFASQKISSQRNLAISTPTTMTMTPTATAAFTPVKSEYQQHTQHQDATTSNPAETPVKADPDSIVPDPNSIPASQSFINNTNTTEYLLRDATSSLFPMNIDATPLPPLNTSQDIMSGILSGITSVPPPPTPSTPRNGDFPMTTPTEFSINDIIPEANVNDINLSNMNTQVSATFKHLASLAATQTTRDATTTTTTANSSSSLPSSYNSLAPDAATTSIPQTNNQQKHPDSPNSKPNRPMKFVSLVTGDIMIRAVTEREWGLSEYIMKAVSTESEVAVQREYVSGVFVPLDKVLLSARAPHSPLQVIEIDESTFTIINKDALEEIRNVVSNSDLSGDNHVQGQFQRPRISQFNWMPATVHTAINMEHLSDAGLAALIEECISDPQFATVYESVQKYYDENGNDIEDSGEHRGVGAVPTWKRIASQLQSIVLSTMVVGD